jgi:FkbM family methyltransferase
VTAPLHERVLFRLGRVARRSPRAAGALLGVLHRVPGSRARIAVGTHVATPFALGVDGSLVVPIVGGGRLAVSTADVTGRTLAVSGVWEPAVTAVVRSLVRPGDVVVDVGANLGYFTVLASRLVGPAGRVIAVEASPRTYRALVANVERNGLANVRALAVAAGAEEGEAELFDVSDGTNAGAASMRRDPVAHDLGAAGVTRVAVPMRPLTALVAADEWPRVGLVKIDVEGYEEDVLRGLSPAFEAGHRPAVVVEVHTDIDAGAPRAVAGFARRHELRPHLVLEQPGEDRHAAARNPQLRPLSAGELAAVTDARFDVLLRP